MAPLARKCDEPQQTGPKFEDLINNLAAIYVIVEQIKTEQQSAIANQTEHEANQPELGGFDFSDVALVKLHGQ